VVREAPGICPWTKFAQGEPVAFKEGPIQSRVSPEMMMAPPGKAQRQAESRGMSSNNNSNDDIDDSCDNNTESQ
jgi:hypothetical protein